MSNPHENAEQLKEVTIYTDGAAVPNPGRGGYGVVLRFGEYCKELSGGSEIPKKKTVKPDQSYYYAWYLYCPGCRAMYMVEAAKREVASGGGRLFEDPA